MKSWCELEHMFGRVDVRSFMEGAASAIENPADS
jgi:hypothetical protein